MDTESTATGRLVGRSLRGAAAVVLAAVLVAAVGSTGVSAQSGQKPARPIGLSAVASHDRVTVSWANPQDASITGYVILRRDTRVHALGNFQTLAETTSSLAYYIDWEVEPEVRYVYRVMARNSDGLSPRSTWVQARTLPAPPESINNVDDDEDDDEDEDVVLPADGDSVPAGASSLGDITGLRKPRFIDGVVNGDDDSIDYYTFSLTAAKQVLLGLRKLDANADLFLEDADGTVLAESTEPLSSVNDSIRRRLGAGTYHIRVEAKHTRRNNTYRLRVGVEAMDSGVGSDSTSLDPADAPDLPGWNVVGDRMLLIPGTKPGSLTDEQLATVTYTLGGGVETHIINHPGDIDWFKVTLDAAHLYVVKVFGRDDSNNNGYTLGHPRISGVFNSSGQHFPYSNAVGDVANPIPALLFYAQHTGSPQTYYVSVSDQYEGAGTFGIMVVAMQDAENWTFGHELGTRGSVTVGEAAASGTIDFKGDADYWEFEATADQRYRVEIQATGTSRSDKIRPFLSGLYWDDPSYQSNPGTRTNDGTTPTDTQLSFRVVSGTPVGGTRESTRAAQGATRLIQVDFTAARTGTHYFGIRTFKIDRGVSFTGPYSVKVTAIDS